MLQPHPPPYQLLDLHRQATQQELDIYGVHGFIYGFA
jgi:hypothetical protein